jgi:F-type H+-transporting ATPase subunit a
VTSTSTSTSGAKGIFVLIGIALLALVLAGFVTGAIGAAFFGTDSLLPEPGVHLPAQMILGDDAGKTLDGGTSFVLTNTILSSLITSGILIALFVIGTARLKVVPGRIQGLLESIIEGLLGFIESLMGVGKGRAILPLIATIFLFVSFNSWIALLPVYQSFGITRYETITLDELNHFAAGQEVTKDDLVHLVEERNAAAHPGEEAHHVIERIEIVNEGTLTKPLIVEAHRFNNGVEAAIVAAGGEIDPTSPGINATFVRPAGTDLNMPLALALIVFVFVEVLGIRAHGIGYFGEFFRFGNLFRGKILTGLIDVFVGLLEGISHLVRVVSFTFRLFGNMTAGEILLLVSSFLVSFVFSIPFYGLELLVGLIQAVIFAGLTVVFAAMAVASHEEEEH